MPYAAFVPLRVHSAYSMLEGAVQPADVAALCRKARFPAAALTDRNNMFAAMEFSEACKAEGVQPIVGALLGIERPGSRSSTSRPVTDWLVLLAQDATGYANLIALVSDAHLDSGAVDDPQLTLDRLAGRTDGLLALTAGPDGALARLLADGQDAGGYADRLQALFPGRLYVEISRTDDPVEAKSEAGLIALAVARDLPLVATNPVRFADAGVHAAHDVLLCIADSAYVDTQDRRRSNPNHWLKSAKEMNELFADLPEACANTLVVAQRCSVKAPARDPILPSLAGDPAAECRKLAEDAAAGLEVRLAALAVADPEPYRERLAFEIGVINRMGFAGYFLIVADFIVWAKGQGIPVGPGRGSGAGSVVAWALTITDLDPILHGLLFERFLNPERVSMPDFDIDFCETRRGEVIRYVQARYGRAQVAQIITFGKLKARAVLKDVGRVLQMPYGQIDRLAKLVPNHPTDPVDAGARHQRRLRARRRARPRSQGRAAAADRAQARRVAAPRLDACRGRRHRRPAAEPAGADVLRSALGHAGHPVRHEVGREGGAGEVRLSRAEDAVGAAARGRAARGARHRPRSRDDPVG